ncbi:DUF397 domain-containing protein [Streptomyces griseorubiginosus]|uniref:DUF397 domain-containing protein n=1 Tax=Streptomyces griseorubiginosus TaxID=67304 RepID=UPI0033AF2F8A
MSMERADDSRCPTWIRSSYSNGAGGECIECASTGTEVLVRDSKLESGPVIILSDNAWHAFVGGVLENRRTVH